MSFCALQTSVPTVITNPATPTAYTAPTSTVVTPGTPVPRSDDNCGVIVPPTPEPPTPEDDLMTFVAMPDTVLCQKNSVVTFNVASALNTVDATKIDHLQVVSPDGTVIRKPPVEFKLLSDTSAIVPSIQGVVTKGSVEGEYIFTPASGFTGAVAQWEYTATDVGTPNVADSTTVVNIRVVDSSPDICRGMEWQGVWQEGKQYKDGYDETCHNRDVVKLDDHSCAYVCIQSHTSDAINRPFHDELDGAAGWIDYWQKIVEVKPPEKSFFDKMLDGIFDWAKNATLGDWLKAIAIGAGIAWAGSKILDMFNKPGNSNVGSNPGGNPSYDPGTQPGRPGSGNGHTPEDPNDPDDPNNPYDPNDPTGGGLGTGPYVPPSVRKVVESLCREGGIKNYDASRLSSTQACHFSLSQMMPVRTVLDNLSKGYQFDMVDSSGTLKFVPRNQNAVAALHPTFLGYTSNGESISPVTVKRIQSVELPRSVSLTYMAEDLDYNNFTQKSEVPSFAEGNDVSLTVPFMMTHDEAKLATDTLLIGAHHERVVYSFKTSYRYGIRLEPGDVISLRASTETDPSFYYGFVRIIAIEEVDEGILEVTAVQALFNGEFHSEINIVDPATGEVIGTTPSPNTGTGLDTQYPVPVLNEALIVTETGAVWFDPPCLNAEDINPRAYCAIHGYGIKGWSGAQVHISRDGGGSYEMIGTTNKESTWGLVEQPAQPADYHSIDTTTTIRVRLKTGTLISKTDAAIFAGENLVMVGQECLSFGIATLVGPNTYDISRLLRGRRGTEWYVNQHKHNELFVVLDDSPFKVEVTEADRGKKFLFKVVSIGSDLSLTESQEIQILGENTVPYTVGNPKIVRNGADYDITWLERPRLANQLRDYIDGTHDFDFGGYLVAIFNGTSIIRHEFVYEPKYTYTLQMQISDFGAAQANVIAALYQVSNKYGGGRVENVNI